MQKGRRGTGKTRRETMEELVRMATLHGPRYIKDCESVVHVKVKPRSRDQYRYYHKPYTKNLTHKFHRNGKVRTV